MLTTGQVLDMMERIMRQEEKERLLQEPEFWGFQFFRDRMMEELDKQI